MARFWNSRAGLRMGRATTITLIRMSTAMTIPMTRLANGHGDAPQLPPLFVALGATALFALFHGVAHGLELPDMSSPWAYAAGFVGATAVLHAAGYAVVRFLPAAAAPLVRIAGAASAATGVWLLAG